MSGLVSLQLGWQVLQRIVVQGIVLWVLGVTSVGVYAQQASNTQSATVEQGQGSEKTWTVNFKETDIQELIRFVAKSLDKTIIIDPKVKGKVQVISSKAVNSDQLYDLFLSILEVHGFAAVESGQVLRVIPSKSARTSPVPVVSETATERSSSIITQVIQLENISAAKLIPVLRPLAPQQAHMAAYAPSNAIIISDTVANIARIKAVIKKIDLSAVQKTEVVALKHASSEEVVRMLEQLKKNETAKGQAQTKKVVIVADKRTNSVLISGDELERARVKALIKHLDTPLAQSGNVRVMYLQYAKATDLSEVLTKVVQNMERMSASNDKTKASVKSTATIEADESTNALIITAEADVMQSLSSVIEKLDIRRAQVLVEAIIVEVNENEGDQLGVEWLFANNSGAYGSSSTPGVASTVVNAAGTTTDGTDPKSAVSAALAAIPGQVLGIGRVSDDLNFNVVLNALQSDSNSNILSTPSLLTLDNEEATIVVGQTISYVTGSYTATGGGGTSNIGQPFQTQEEKDVGITLKITPHINEGDSLILEIEQEASTIVAGQQFNSNPTTNERKISTKVLVDNEQTIVLGGLMQDMVTKQDQRVPILGSIPIIGALFRSSSDTVVKLHLFVFIRATIIRDKHEMSVATGEKYRFIRDKRFGDDGGNSALFDDESLPLLPEWKKQLEALYQQRDQLHEVQEQQPAEALEAVQ
ncbi:MAG: type II secretion system secretin GspD [Spongiibacteraceae bacterium]|nr:type II secretion system secretin GspD [Spongiibacteraceae bacterium]